VVKHGRACHYFVRSISFDLIRGLPQRLVEIGESVSVCRALRPAGRPRHRVAVSCPALMRQTALLLMISVNRMLGHIDHRRPLQVRGSKESRLDCPALQTLRGQQILIFLVNVESSSRASSPKKTWQHQGRRLISISCGGLIDEDVVSRERWGVLTRGRAYS
jgi:hypothetical protein